MAKRTKDFLAQNVPRCKPDTVYFCGALLLTGLLLGACSKQGRDRNDATVEVEELPPLHPGGYVEPMAINASGIVVGYAEAVDGSLHAFRWDGGNSLTDLGTLPSRPDRSYAYDINDAEVIVGFSSGEFDASNEGAPFWANASAMTELNPLAPDNDAIAYGVSDMGQAVGMSGITGPAVTWILSAGADPTQLATFGDLFSTAYAISDTGGIAGCADILPSAAEGQLHAARWPPTGGITDLGTLGGPESCAYAINDAGHVVGKADTVSTGLAHAFFWDGAMMSDLETLPGGQRSSATGVNNLGWVVGASETGANSAAFLYRDDVLVDLNTLLPEGSQLELDDARAINDAGQIVGVGYTPNGSGAFRITLPPAGPSPSPTVTPTASASPTPTPVPCNAFFDDFETGSPDAAWDNNFGNWQVIFDGDSDYTYVSVAPNNDPPATSFITGLNLTNFTIKVDIKGGQDGGVFVRSAGSNDAVVFIFRPGNDSYWHVRQGGVWGPALNSVSAAAIPADTDFSVTVTVTGNMFTGSMRAGATDVTTTLTDGTFSGGGVGLYSFGAQSYDDVCLETTL